MDETKLNNYLNIEEDDLVGKLKSLFQMPIHPDISSAEIQIFLDDEDGSNASFWIYFDGRNKKIDKTDEGLFPGRSMQLFNLDLSEKEIYENSEYEDKFEYLDSLANLIKNWFIVCWQKSGGQNYSIPLEIAVHDGFGDGKVTKIS